MTSCAPAIAARIAAALYFVDADSPPTSPASANRRSETSPGDSNARSTASIRIARDPVTRSVVSTSVIAKCESRTCRIATASKKAAIKPVV